MDQLGSLREMHPPDRSPELGRGLRLARQQMASDPNREAFCQDHTLHIRPATGEERFYTSDDILDLAHVRSGELALIHSSVSPVDSLTGRRAASSASCLRKADVCRRAT